MDQASLRLGIASQYSPFNINSLYQSILLSLPNGRFFLSPFLSNASGGMTNVLVLEISQFDFLLDEVG